jgi:hypothetical protein
VDTLCEKFYSDNTIHYNYCGECKIIFRYDDTNIHHYLYKTGNLYYAEIISKFTCFNNTNNFCPQFKDFNQERRNEFIELYKKEDIKIEWIKYVNIEECCVCFENTSHNTECSHVVCIECLKTLQKCPICRHNLQYKNTVYENHLIEYDDEVLYGGPGYYPEDDETDINDNFYGNVD